MLRGNREAAMVKETASGPLPALELPEVGWALPASKKPIFLPWGVPAARYIPGKVLTRGSQMGGPCSWREA